MPVYTYRTIAYHEELQNWSKNVLGFFNRRPYGFLEQTFAKINSRFI